MDGKGVKRKKKSFRQKIMKFHKNGVNGKGVKVDDESFEYFLHVLKIMNQDFESDEEKSNIIFSDFILVNTHSVSFVMFFCRRFCAKRLRTVEKPRS